MQSGVSAPVVVVVVESSPSSQSEFSDVGGRESSSSSLLSGSSDTDTVSGVEIPTIFSYGLPPASCLGCKKVAGPFKGDSQWKCFHCECTLDLKSSYSLVGCAGCTGVNARPTLGCDKPDCHAAAFDRVQPFKVVGGKGRKKKRNRSCSDSDTPTEPIVPVKRAASSKRRNLTDSSSGSEMEQEEVKDTCPKPTPAPRTSRGHPPKPPESAPT